jgi:hypothetical protein
MGHESMKDGTPDLSKGSFYVNPVVDKFTGVAPELLEKYPTFFGDNVFPSELPKFEQAVKEASRLMIAVCMGINSLSTGLGMMRNAHFQCPRALAR